MNTENEINNFYLCSRCQNSVHIKELKKEDGSYYCNKCLADQSYEYPRFEKGEQVEVDFCGVIIKGEFIEWSPKDDRPFGCWLVVKQGRDNFHSNLQLRLERNLISSEESSIYIKEYPNGLIRRLNDQFIISINGEQFNCHPQ